jgi:putative redox protein
MKKQHHVKTDWVGRLAFDSHIKDQQVRIDTREPQGFGSGPNPKPLMLSALAGCTGMDVVALLQKMRVEIDSLSMDIEADLTEEHPQVYEHIRMVYYVKGPELAAKKDKVEKAISLSQERYCGVTAMMKKICPIDFRVEIENSGD